MVKGAVIAAIAVVAVVAVAAVAAVVFLLPNEKSAKDLMPDVGSFPDNWTRDSVTDMTNEVTLDDLSSMAVGIYLSPNSPQDTLTVTIQVYNSVAAAENNAYSKSAFAAWSPTDTEYFDNSFTVTNGSGTHYFFQYKSVVGWLHLQTGTLSSDPANDEWGRILTDIGGKIESAGKLV